MFPAGSERLGHCTEAWKMAVRSTIASERARQRGALKDDTKLRVMFVPSIIGAEQNYVYSSV